MKLSDQAHALADVDYHFSNRWFAAQKQNWPLANFYVAETKAHLEWAVSIRPVWKLTNGRAGAAPSSKGPPFSLFP